MKERLQKIISAAGIASRRHAEKLITAGRVSVDDIVVKELGVKADAERNIIRVDGKIISVEKIHAPNFRFAKLLIFLILPFFYATPSVQISRKVPFLHCGHFLLTSSNDVFTFCDLQCGHFLSSFRFSIP